MQPPFPHLSLSAPQTLLTKLGGVLSVQRLQLSFVYTWTLLFTSCVISCHLAPVPISLLIASYLPAITVLMPKTNKNNSTVTLVRFWEEAKVDLYIQSTTFIFI